MTDQIARLDEIKRKIRKLKQLEAKIRFGDYGRQPVNLVWDRFFDLHDLPSRRSKYSLHDLATMTREQYRQVIDEYFSYVYFELYKECGFAYISKVKAFDPEILARLDLPFNAAEDDVKRRFRELAKQLHPDTGGDAAAFIALMEDYRKLIEK